MTVSAWMDRDEGAGGDGPEGALFPWWSFTKTVMSICALRLAEAGALDLEEPLPGRPYSILHLMAHRAGVRDYGGLESYRKAVASGEASWPVARLLDEAGADTPLWPPGYGFAYSNIGYLELRDVLERAAGCDMGRMVARLITGPLGLTSVSLATTPQEFERIHWDSAGGYHPGWVYHGCLMGSAGDAARVLHTVMTGGLISEQSLKKMQTSHFTGGAIPGRPWSAIGYGLGLMQGVVEGLGPALGHSGCGPFCANAVYHFPNTGVTVASFTDGGDEAPAEWEATRIAREIAASR
ncbi:serine hydrolase domain-containing protein [Alterinioella nitratireducens]|uniref:serine hydrolase domain-containing protein n=1 Tax=Alterinioella nitratireducens TaxID=2735915 RepID=UPI00155325B0|nr:serine hydrolase domain-containing protein [Alterinioella nitratireducens]NPD20381.1 beta-lactamase family protein [Alterinioella nitratireducens]